MKKTVVRSLSLVLSVLFAVMIFRFSAQNAEISGNSSEELTEKIIQIFVPTFDSANPSDEGMFLTIEAVIRKLAHFTEYFLLGASLCLFFLTFRWKKPYYLILPGGVTALYAISDEIHQAFVPGRGPSVADVLLDTFGGLCGAILILLILYIWQRIKKKNGVTP